MVSAGPTALISPSLEEEIHCFNVNIHFKAEQRTEPTAEVDKMQFRANESLRCSKMAAALRISLL